ncbi:MAG TPA: hypothetical protein VGM41_01945 [Chitinophagaceae bacterium]|jgi:glycosyltransferase involved in cell wall biosynthesis
MDRKKTLVIAIYSHPEYYPPTLNAITYLSGYFDRIYIVHRNITAFDWEYPANVELLYAGALLPVGQAEQQSTQDKIKSFWQFSRLLSRIIRSSGAKTLLVYDYLPWLAYRLIKPRMPKDLLLWYHNHDVAEKQYVKKGSISWWAWKSEQWVFPRLNIFSLPSVERQAFFPMNKFKGKFFFVPNYPSVAVYGANNKQAKSMTGPIRLLFQGSIGELHGLEEIIALLSSSIGGRPLELVLKGFISEEYKTRLRQLAEAHGVADKLVVLPLTGYKEVIKNAQTCHIGIGIHKKQDLMNKTLGTASNKIYEYAASGMPVLVYDNSHFRDTLGNRPWVFFTDTSAGSLLHCLEQIMDNYMQLSSSARKDFEEELCFEHYFTPLLEYLSERDKALTYKSGSI